MGWILGVFSFIGHILHLIGDALVIALKWFVVHMWAVVRFVVDHLVKVAQALKRAAMFLWEDAIKPVIQFLQKIYDKVEVFLKAHLGPILAVIHKIVSAVDWIYQHIVHPLIATIEFLRAFFRVLGDLGIEWAKKVDEFLGRIELKIWSAFELLRSWINHVLGIFAYLLDPFGMIRRGHLLGVFGRDLAHLISLTVHAQPKRHLGNQGDVPIPPRSGMRVPIDQVKSGELQESETVKAMVEAFDRYTEELGA